MLFSAFAAVGVGTPPSVFSPVLPLLSWAVLPSAPNVLPAGASVGIPMGEANVPVSARTTGLLPPSLLPPFWPLSGWPVVKLKGAGGVGV